MLVVLAGCAAEDDERPESHPIEWIDQEPLHPDTWDGITWVSSVWYDYGKENHRTSFDAGASFRGPGRDLVFREQFVIWDRQDGVDDCGLTEALDVRDSTGPPRGRPGVDAGAVWVEPPGGRIPMPSDYFVGSYYAALKEYGYHADPGGTYAFSGEGADSLGSSAAGFPAFEIAVEMPHRLELVAPDHGEPLRGDLELEWTGKGKAPLRIELEVHPPGGGHRWTLTCVVEDDESFVIPSALVDPLPEGGSVFWRLERAEVVEIELPSGELVGAAAEWAYEVYP